jgi:hypothetical protein
VHIIPSLRRSKSLPFALGTILCRCTMLLVYSVSVTREYKYIATIMKCGRCKSGSIARGYSQKDQDSISGGDRGLSHRHVTQSNVITHWYGVIKMQKTLAAKHTRLVSRLKCMELYTQYQYTFSRHGTCEHDQIHLRQIEFLFQILSLFALCL